MSQSVRSLDHIGLQHRGVGLQHGSPTVAGRSSIRVVSTHRSSTLVRVWVRVWVRVRVRVRVRVDYGSGVHTVTRRHSSSTSNRGRSTG
eukprot:scaffold73839_cov36-Phaeocystis_antarctica.AAC.1